MKRKTDVLLINPRRVGMDSYCTPPLHLMCLKKAINEAGYEAQILNVHERYNRVLGRYHNQDKRFDIKRKVEKECTDEILLWDVKLFGIGGVCPSYEFAEQLVNSINPTT